MRRRGKQAVLAGLVCVVATAVGLMALASPATPQRRGADPLAVQSKSDPAKAKLDEQLQKLAGLKGVVGVNLVQFKRTASPLGDRRPAS